MDLNTIEAVLHPANRAGLPKNRAGDAFLAGGTWLFSEPQTRLLRLVDLTAMGWRALRCDTDGLVIGATCTLAELEMAVFPTAWQAGPLFAQCCRALLGSFKIRNVATVGGNLCLALPAGPMAALLTALKGMCTIWTSDGGERHLSVSDFILGANANALCQGEILRAVSVSEEMLRSRVAFRQISLTPMGRSAALLVGTWSQHGFDLTITASLAKPVTVSFDGFPTTEDLIQQIEESVPIWYDDVHGAPAWRRRVTHIMATEIVSELAS